MTAHLTVGFSFYVWSFLLWSFHIWYKVVSSTCYIFLPLFLFHWFSEVVKTFTLISETSVILLRKLLPSDAEKNYLVKNEEHNLLEAFSDLLRRDVQLGRFILLSDPISQQLPRLASLYFLSFLIWPLKLDCAFPWQKSGGSEQLIAPNGCNLIPRK